VSRPPPPWRLISVLFSSVALTPALAMTLVEAARTLVRTGAGMQQVAGDTLSGRVTDLRKDVVLGGIAGPSFEASLETERGAATVRYLLTRDALDPEPVPLPN
jgi:hypothetical protein